MAVLSLYLLFNSALDNVVVSFSHVNDNNLVVVRLEGFVVVSKEGVGLTFLAGGEDRVDCGGRVALMIWYPRKLGADTSR